MSIVNSAKDLANTLVFGDVPVQLPSHVPALPPVDERLKLENWRTDIDQSFVIPKSITFDSDTNSESIKRRNKREVESNESPANGFDQFIEFLKNLMHGLVKSIQEEQFWKDTGIALSFDISLPIIRKLCKKLINFVENGLTKKIYQTISMKSFGHIVLQNTVRSVVKTTVTRMGFRMLGKITTTLAKITISATSVIGIITAIGATLDLLFTVWDPFNYNKMLPKNLPRDLLRNGILTFRQSFDNGDTSYKFNMFVSTQLNETEMLELVLKTFTDRAAHLQSLDVNSEGSWIDKGNPIDLNTSGNHLDVVINDTFKKAHAKIIQFDLSDYYKYNEGFIKRVKFNQVVCKSVYVTSALVIIFSLIGAQLLAVLFLLTTRYNIIDDHSFVRRPGRYAYKTIRFSKIIISF